MGIEPLGSIMTVQAQNTVPLKPAVQTAETAEEYSNANVQDVDQIDKTMSVVENAQDKGDADSNEQNSQATNDQIKKAVEQLNKKMSTHSEAIFGIHEKTNRVTIKIVDKDTRKVLRELPPEKTLDMIAKVWEMAGILVDEKR